MNIEYCIGQASDRAEIIDFLNMVFSQDGTPHDFRHLLPKLYGDEADSSSCHYLVKEDGKIKAAIGVFPAQMNVCGRLLKIGHVGSVSVHGYSRGKGYMKELMHQAIQDSLRKNYDALVLGGLKNRYQYFGFQPAETVLRYTFISENIRHALRHTDDTGIRFEKISSHRHPYLKEMQELHKKQPSYTRRGNDAEFFRVLQSWASESYAVKKDSRYIGYLVAAADGTCFHEILLENMSCFPEVLKAWFAFRNITRLSLSCAPYETEKNELFGKYCEEYSIGSGHSWNILNFRKVAEAFLAVKASCESLEAGTLTLDIEPIENLLPGAQCQLTYPCIPGISDMTGTSAAAPRTGLPGQTIRISHLDATEGLFSSLTSYRTYGHTNGIQYKNWMPLPLYLSELDAC